MILQVVPSVEPRWQKSYLDKNRIKDTLNLLIKNVLLKKLVINKKLWIDQIFFLADLGHHKYLCPLRGLTISFIMSVSNKHTNIWFPKKKKQYC